MTPQDAERALSALEGFSFQHVRELSGGWAYWTFKVNGRWIFRFPRTASVARAAAKELRLLPVLAGRIGCEVPAPAWQGTHGGLPFFGYRKIAGRPVNARDLLRNPSLAGEIAGCLRRLHTVGLPEAMRLVGEGGVQAWRREHEELMAAARERVGPLLSATEAQSLDDAFAAFLEELRFTPALVHRDLGPEHVLIDASGRLAGIIDWEDAAVGDPAIDFAGFSRAFGQEATGEILAAYGPDAMRQRILAYAWIADVHDLLHGLDAGDTRVVRGALARLRVAGRRALSRTDLQRYLPRQQQNYGEYLEGSGAGPVEPVVRGEETNALEQEVRDRLDGMQAQLSSIARHMVSKADLEELEQRMASKADLKELEQRMASKADLEELEQRMASKADLEALRTATKADLEALRTATKADMEALEQRMASKADLEALRTATKADLKALRTATKADMDALEQRVASQVNAKIDALGRQVATGIASIVDRLDAQLKGRKDDEITLYRIADDHERRIRRLEEGTP